MSFSVPELEDAEVIFDIGYNAPVSHPLVARHIVRAKKKGCKIICVDPRLTETGRIATIYLPIKGGTNMLFLNAMAQALPTMPKKWPRKNTLRKPSLRQPISTPATSAGLRACSPRPSTP